MNDSLETQKSFLWSSLNEFCEETLAVKRKSLNLSQKNVAQRLGLSQSEVSRIERGLVSPKDLTIIQAICSVYKLSEHQKQKYLELTLGNYQPKSVDFVVNLLEHQINFIAHLNRSGNPKVAITQAESLRIWIQNNTRLVHLKDIQIEQKVLHLLLEESAAWWDIVSIDSLRIYTQPLLKQMETLLSYQKPPNQNKLKPYFQINKGFHSYIKGEYEKALENLVRVIENPTFTNNFWYVETLRAVTVIAGKLNKKDMLEKYEQMIVYYLNESTDSQTKGYLLEGLGRAYSTLNQKKSKLIFKKAKEYFDAAQKQTGVLSIRHIQYTRSYLDLLKQMGVDQQSLKDMARPVLKQAEQAGFERHREQLIKIIGE